MDSLLRLALFVSGVTVLLTLGGLAQAGEFKRFPEYAYEAKVDSDIEALKELLRQAQELQKSQDAVKAAAESEAGSEVSEAPSADAAQAADAEAANKPGAKASAPPPAAQSVPSQAGCMYRGHKLIWERVPGSCKP